MLSPKSLRKGLLIVHLSLGLFLGLYFSVVGASGSLLVFGDNLQARFMPEIAYCAPPTPGAPLLPLSELIARVRTSPLHPAEKDLATILTPAGPAGAYRFLVNVQDPAARRIVTADPYDGHVIRNQQESTTFVGFIRRVHVFLLMDAPGELANGIGAILVMLLLLSGLWLWWPKTRAQLKARLTVKKDAGPRRFLLDLHHVFGIYSFGLLLVIAVTGALFVFPQPVQAVIARLNPAPVSRKPPPVVPPPGAKRLPIEQLVAIAEPIAPEIKISSLAYPAKPGQPFSCYKRSFGLGFLPYVNIFIDPYTGQVLKVADDRTASLAVKIPRVLSMSHFGYWGGLFVKCLYALVGLVPSGLFVTGFLLWWRKKRPAREKTAT